MAGVQRQQRGGKEGEEPGSSLPMGICWMGSDLHRGPGGFSLSAAGEMAAGQQEPRLKPTSAWSQHTANTRLVGQRAGNHSWSQGWKGPRGLAVTSPELGTCQGPTGPAQPTVN